MNTLRCALMGHLMMLFYLIVPLTAWSQEPSHADDAPVYDLSIGDDVLAQSDESAGDDATPAANDAPQEVTLREAIALAMERSPQLKAQQYAVGRADSVTTEAYWAWTPKFSTNTTFIPIPSVDPGQNQAEILNNLNLGGVSLTNDIDMVVPIFTFFKLDRAYDLANVGLDVEELKLEEERLKVMFDVVQAYFAVQGADAARSVLRKASGDVDRAERALEKLLEQDSANVNDSDRAQLKLARTEFEAQVFEAEQNQVLARSSLRVHTMLEGAITVPTMNYRPDKITLKTQDEILRMADQQRLDLRQLERGVEAARLNVRLEELKWTPDFYFAARATINYNSEIEREIPNGPNGEDFQSIQIYLNNPYNARGFGFFFGLRWNIDPVRQSQKVRQANFQYLQVQEQAKIARRGAHLQVETEYVKTVIALNNSRNALLQRRAAKKRMVPMLADFEVGGTLTNVDLLVRAVRQYYEKQAEYIAALAAFRIQLFKLQLMVGAKSVNELLAEGIIKDFGEEPSAGPSDDADDEDDE